MIDKHLSAAWHLISPTDVRLTQTAACYRPKGSQRGGKNATTRLSLFPPCCFLQKQTLEEKKQEKGKGKSECGRRENRERQRQRLTHGQLIRDTNPQIMLIFLPLSRAKCFHTTPFICGGRDVNLFSGWHGHFLCGFWVISTSSRPFSFALFKLMVFLGAATEDLGPQTLCWEFGEWFPAPAPNTPTICCCWKDQTPQRLLDSTDNQMDSLGSDRWPNSLGWAITLLLTQYVRVWGIH